MDRRWAGKLAVAARPRGGDWLSDDIARWKRDGISVVLSLLTPEEEKDLDLKAESGEVRAHGLDFSSLPIIYLQVPKSEVKLAETLDSISGRLSSGKNVVVHCRQGIGRSGLIAICLLVKEVISPGAAVEFVSTARGIQVPETAEQRDWIEHHATAFTK